MTVMPHALRASCPSPGEPSPRRDVRVVPAAVWLGLLAVLFALTVPLVENRWEPLLRVDSGARDSLHRYVVTHVGFVTAMRLISDAGRQRHGLWS
jgi:hypothetical protein